MGEGTVALTSYWKGQEPLRKLRVRYDYCAMKNKLLALASFRQMTCSSLTSDQKHHIGRKRFVQAAKGSPSPSNPSGAQGTPTGAGAGAGAGAHRARATAAE